MRILVLGGYGFLGGRIAKYLSGMDFEVVLGTSTLRDELGLKINCRSIYIDGNDERSIIAGCKGVDVIVNASGMNSKECLINPTEAFAVNCMSLGRLAAAAKIEGVKLFLSISTAHIYSSELEGIISEESCPKNYHPYASSHLAGENALLSIAKDSNMKAVILRLSNAFGSPVFDNKGCWNLVVNDLCRQSAISSTLIVKSSGRQYRDFIGINMVCKVMKLLIEKNDPSLLSNIYNLGSGYSKTINEVAELIKERTKILFKKNLCIQNLGASSQTLFDQFYYKVDKLKELGFMPTEQENLTELDELIQYCYDNHGINF